MRNRVTNKSAVVRLSTGKNSNKLDLLGDTLGKIPEDSAMEVDQFDSSSLDISSVDFQQAHDDNLSVHQR